MNSVRRDIEPLPDPRQRPTLLVQSHSVLDLIRCEPASPKLDAAAVEQSAYSALADLVPLGQRTERGTILVPLDKVGYLGLRQSIGGTPVRSRCLSGRVRDRFVTIDGGVMHLSQQADQGFYESGLV